MKVNILAGVGAEITGVELSNGSSVLESDEIRAIFAEHGLVFFRDQQLSEENHIKFAQTFGEINVNRFFVSNGQYPEIAMVTKEPDQIANIGGGWHTDHSYDNEPALGSILVARELPNKGGDTWFASMYKAFETLSPGLKRTLEGLSAVHSAKHVFGSASGYGKDGKDEGDAAKDRIGNSDVADEMEDPIHPVVIRHPLSGRKALYVNPTFTLRFDGWTTKESAPLLEFLYQHAVDDRFVTRFKWQPGSIAFWDNRATWHFAQNDYQGERRVMHRITVEGCPLSAASS
ncbi:MAG: taurine dioxygenase [Candidatus Azotimanducaceae bacterium]|jgi:taurine dioxygenase